MSGVAIQHRGIPSVDLARVVQDDDLWEQSVQKLHQGPHSTARAANTTYLGIEVVGSLRWVILAVASNVPTADFLNRHVLDVEAHIVSRDSFRQRLVVHLHGLHLSGQVYRSKSDNHAWLEKTSFHTTNGYSSNT